MEQAGDNQQEQDSQQQQQFSLQLTPRPHVPTHLPAGLFTLPFRNRRLKYEDNIPQLIAEQERLAVEEESDNEFDPAPVASALNTNSHTGNPSSEDKGKVREMASETASPGGSASTPAAVASEPKLEVRKLKKRKVLLMGKSGSGKSSMRSIIFSNYVPADTRRLGATIDVDLSHVKFLGNLTLNLWDCGGQEAFMENYINQQRVHVFSNVGVLIYVFDIESRDVDRDLATYVSVVTALAQYSPSAKVFVLIHKMDLIIGAQREQIFNERVRLAKAKTAEALQNMAAIGGHAPERLEIQPFATSIWDQSLYKAWSAIIHDLIPNLAIIEEELGRLGTAIEAEEILLYERTSFLVISKWSSPEGQRNPAVDRYERLSNVWKTFKASLAKYTGTSRNADQIRDFTLKISSLCAVFMMQFTTNTFIQVVMPPGEARFNSARLNTAIAAKHFERLDSPANAAAAAAAAAATGAKGAAAGKDVAASGSGQVGLTPAGEDPSGDAS